MFNVEFAPKTLKFLANCDAELRERIVKKIELLQADPFPRDAKQLAGWGEKVLRIRVGGYRVLYAVSFEKHVVLISRIDKRGRVYE